MYIPIRTILTIFLVIYIHSNLCATSSMAEYKKTVGLGICNKECRHNDKIDFDFLSSSGDEILDYHLSQFRIAIQENNSLVARHHSKFIFMNCKNVMSIEFLNSISDEIIRKLKGNTFEVETLTDIAYNYRLFSYHNKALELNYRALSICKNNERAVNDRIYNRLRISYQIAFIYSSVSQKSKSIALYSDSLLDEVVCFMQSDMQTNSKRNPYLYTVLTLEVLTRKYLGTPEYDRYLQYFDANKASEKVAFLYQWMDLTNKAYKCKDAESMANLLDFIEMGNDKLDNFQNYIFIYSQICISVFDIGFHILPLEKQNKSIDKIIENSAYFSPVEKTKLFPKIIDYYSQNNTAQSEYLLEELLKTYRVQVPNLVNHSDNFLNTQFDNISQSTLDIKGAQKTNLALFFLALGAGLISLISIIIINLKIRSNRKFLNINQKLNEQRNYIQRRTTELHAFAKLLNFTFKKSKNNLNTAFDYSTLDTLSREERSQIISSNTSTINSLESTVQNFLTYTLSNEKQFKNQKWIKLMDCCEMAVYHLNNKKVNIHFPKSDIETLGNMKDWIDVFQKIFIHSIDNYPLIDNLKIDVHFRNDKNYSTVIIRSNVPISVDQNNDSLFEAFTSNAHGIENIKSNLNLAVVKNILNKYNSTISLINSNEKQYTTFCIRIFHPKKEKTYQQRITQKQQDY